MDETILHFITASSALATALATVVLALLTLALTKENRMLRLAGRDAHVVAHLAPSEQGTGAVEFVLSNVGNGPAMNVAFEFQFDPAEPHLADVLIHDIPDRPPLALIASQSSFRSLFGMGFTLFEGQILRPFVVRVSFDDLNGRRHSADYPIDIRQFAGLPGIVSTPSQERLARSVEKIESHLAKISRNTSEVPAEVDLTKISDAYRVKGKP
jgi:hypothetical protein